MIDVPQTCFKLEIDNVVCRLHTITHMYANVDCFREVDKCRLNPFG